VKDPDLTHGVERLLTAGEVAAALSVSTKSVLRWAAAGRLTGVRLGEATVRFRRSDVERFIQASGVSPSAGPR
jgi:excisionase family DNA binding protein